MLPFYQKLLHVEEARRTDSRYDTLDLIVDENCSRNSSIGFQLLKLIVDKGNEVNYVPRVVFRYQLTAQEVADKVWELIESKSFKHKVFWKRSFLYHLNESLASKKYADSIIQTIDESEESINIDLGRLTKFLRVDQEIFQECSEQ